MGTEQPDKRTTVVDIRARKGGRPLVCLTAYTALTAVLLDEHVDLLLVGDSLGMVLYGLDTTVAVSLDMMIAHGAAVMRGAILYHRSLIMTPRDGLPRFSARSVRRRDAGHRKAYATMSESLGRPPFGSRMRPVGGRRNTLTMHRIARGLSPTRRAAYAISRGHYQ